MSASATQGGHNKTSRGSPALATVRIAPKICKGQTPPPANVL